MVRKIIGSVFDRNNRNNMNDNFEYLFNNSGRMIKQLNDLVLESGHSDTEVVQARGGKTVLNDRFVDIENELVETNKNKADKSELSQLKDEKADKSEINYLDDAKAEKTEVNKLSDKKADREALEKVANSKRDKNVEIEMKDLSQSVKEALTGGSVAVVGKDAIGNDNLKENAVTREKMNKNYAINYPYLSDESFDLDYVIDEGNYIVSSPVLNNPFKASSALNVTRHKTRDTNNNVWIVQTLTVYESGSDIGDSKKRLLRVNEDTSSIALKSEWKDITKNFTDDMLSDDYAHKDYLGGNEYDLNDIKKEGNYIINANVINNPFKSGCTLTVTRHKLKKSDKTLWVVQECVVYASARRGKRAWRIIRYKSNGEFDYASEWQGDVVNETINVLWISNSFGLNTTEYIHELANATDVNIVNSNLYISGGTLSDQYDNIVKDSKVYRLVTKGNENGVTLNKTSNDVSINEALNMREWDYVVFNQASSQSGVSDSFQPYLNDIIAHIKGKLPNVKIALMPTWAYSNNFDDRRFDKYDNDQLKMYKDIMSAYKNMMSEIDFDLIIPSGTAVQNARSDEYLMSIDDELTRDGYHLGETGMYIAGITFIRSFFGDIEINWKPTNVSKRAAYFAKVSADNAILNPFKVTQI